MSSERSNNKKGPKRSSLVSMGMTLGAGIGVAFGNIAIGAAIGMTFGMLKKD